jgi:hypothetical protein
MANLILHCGAHLVPRTQLATTPTPAATKTWQPIPHEDFVKQVEELLPRYNLRVANESHALTHDAARYFGLMEIQNGANHPDYTWVLGLRNSHDQAFSAGVVAGSQVFCCDNLAFSGDVQVSRKHTRFIMRDLPELVSGAIERLVHRWHDQDHRIDAYKNCRLGDSEAHDLVIQSLDRGVISGSRVPEVLQEWRKPRHDAFQPRNTWSLFNAFTEVMKGRGLHLLPKRTQALHGLCDQFVGLN